jgi:hypothetical protein
VSVPSTLEAIAMGARASGRSSWLIAPGVLVAFLRTVLGWPLPFFAIALATAGVDARLHDGMLHPIAVVAGAIDALTAPRSLFILGGLWAAGLLMGAVLRVAWVAGALPALGVHLTRTPRPESGFVEGIVFGFAPMLGTAALGLVVEVTAQVYAWCVYLAAALVALRGGGGQPTLAALLAAAALITAIAAPILASLVADAALARNALAGDSPTRAVAVGARRVVLRPGAFLLSAFVLGVAGMVILGAAQTMETALLGVAGGASPWLVLGPRLMATTLAAALATLLELWRLGTIAALACAADEA